jgi:amino acid transporter
MYGKDIGFLKNTLGRTNNGNTSVAVILCCSLFGLLAFVGLADQSFNQGRRHVHVI